MTKILSVRDIEYRHFIKRGLFGKQQIFTLGPISFDMYKGETIALIGNNGSGKSMLAKALVGALQIEKGEIELMPDADAPAEYAETQVESPAKGANDDSQRFSVALPQEARINARKQDIRMILQHSADALNPALSIGTVLNQTLKLNTKLGETARREKIEETLVKVGLLREHYYFYRHMLSDGQQQRIALARALLLDPKIIVADEPFAALDPSVRSQTVNLILQLQKELGLSFVFISHNIGIVRHISDRVIVLDKGQIIEQGVTSEVFTNPQQAITQKLIQSHFDLVEKHFAKL
ncbi:ATP-binding cassette domain-containing protein [Glaciecola sp. XM2]|jgi:cationic peptide transport system ATP-binding protein|uniref:ATP-binding cassette domain-containing protein n=1 Tax=Glaciecola sp. XM2 TaxID=1914931 RepID=UPI001BDF5F3F|nr:ATP-binding cassette domain-containing protein [Glaciecola sp. XM2]MBT1450866.1 ATP-binding cassette domain-containing protein [Glaciecola sp. XM2]